MVAVVYGHPNARLIAEKVAAFLNKAGDADTIALAEQHVNIVTVFVRSYTRGRGFTDGLPNDDLEAVIIPVTCRYTANPEQVRQYASGDYSETPVTLTGFTLLELAVLNLYRRRVG